MTRAFQGDDLKKSCYICPVRKKTTANETLKKMKKNHLEIWWRRHYGNSPGQIALQHHARDAAERKVHYQQHICNDDNSIKQECILLMAWLSVEQNLQQVLQGHTRARELTPGITTLRSNKILVLMAIHYRFSRQVSSHLWRMIL